MKQLLMFLALLAGCLPAYGEHDVPERSVQVTTSGSVSRAPDRARVLLAVETSDRTAQKATEQNATSMSRVLSRLKRSDLTKAEVRTLGFRLSPRYDHEDRRRIEPVGYVAANTIQVTVDDVDMAGRLLDAALGAGANRVTGLTFELRDPESAYLAALEKAMAAAGRQAKVLAAAAGQELGPPIRIATSGGVRPVEIARTQAFARAAATPIEPGNVTTTATVTATYALAED